MTIVAEELRYDALDLAMHGRLFRDDRWQGPRPAVMLFPEGFGISEHTYDAARRVVELGYVGVACDLYGEAYFFNGPSDETLARNTRIGGDQSLLRAIGLAPLTLLQARADVDPARIAAAGYCFGGTVAMEMGFAGADIRAIASFHPAFRGMTYADAGKVRCPMHLFVGAEDYAAPPEVRGVFEAAMRASPAPWRLTLYGGVRHSFTNPRCEGMGEHVRFDEPADRHSWESMAALLAEVFG